MIRKRTLTERVTVYLKDRQRQHFSNSYGSAGYGVNHSLHAELAAWYSDARWFFEGITREEAK